MEELSIEEKARRYDEAIAKGKQIQNTPYTAHWDTMKEVVEHLFPELAEDEDERIRSSLIRLLQVGGYMSPEDKDKAFAWLEKQREQKPDDKVKAKQTSDLEKGKWYVCDTPRYKDFIVGKAYYCPKNEMLISYEDDLPRYVAKHCFHPWDIKDAKDGDILASSSSIFIFQKEYMAGKPTAYCGIMNDGVLISGQGGCWTNEQCYPATPGQCDLLFQKLKEAGYEWDSEKKELKKIEQKSAWWNKEDERILYNVKAYVGYAAGQRGVKDELFKEANDWLISLQEKYAWKPSDEQMRAFYKYLNEGDKILALSESLLLRQLYNDLKKLK